MNINSYSGGASLWNHEEKKRLQRRYSYGDYEQFEEENRSMRYGPDSYHSDFFHLQLPSGVHKLTMEEKYRKVTACDLPSSCQDGLIDVVSVRSAFHLGQIRVGLSNAQKICQCREAIITNKKAVAVQVDGEPWKQDFPSTLKITRKKDPAFMLHRAADDGGGAETEMAKLLDWAEERQIIDQNVHATLMKEFSRRIESKIRQKKFNAQENLMKSLKKVISKNNF